MAAMTTIMTTTTIAGSKVLPPLPRAGEGRGEGLAA